MLHLTQYLRMGNAVVALQIKYRSSSLSERAESRPQLDALLTKYAEYQNNLLDEGIFTTDKDLEEVAIIREEINQAAQTQQLIKAIAKTVAFVATRQSKV